jgi:hypothetical protein
MGKGVVLRVCSAGSTPFRWHRVPLRRHSLQHETVGLPPVAGLLAAAAWVRKRGGQRLARGLRLSNCPSKKKGASEQAQTQQAHAQQAQAQQAQVLQASLSRSCSSSRRCRSCSSKPRRSQRDCGAGRPRGCANGQLSQIGLSQIGQLPTNRSDASEMGGALGGTVV